jgi:hypothetical protein
MPYGDEEAQRKRSILRQNSMVDRSNMIFSSFKFSPLRLCFCVTFPSSPLQLSVAIVRYRIHSLFAEAMAVSRAFPPTTSRIYPLARRTSEAMSRTMRLPAAAISFGV